MSQKTLEYSPLFARRFEQVEVVQISHKPKLEQLLGALGFHRSHSSNDATTYFSNSLGGNIWQWHNAITGNEIVVRFRQRFPEELLLQNNHFTLQGGGDLEFKIHSDDPTHNGKRSVHVPAAVGIETLVELSHTDMHNFWQLVSELSAGTQHNSINPLALAARIGTGLSPLVTRTSHRTTFIHPITGARVTLDGANCFFAFPFLANDEPIYQGRLVAEQSKLLKVDVKAKSPSDVTGLLKQIQTFSTGDHRIETGMTFPQMREKALKQTQTIVKEEADYEFEAKLNIEVHPQDISIESMLSALRQKIEQGAIPGFRISTLFPFSESREADQALRSIYGWTDDQGKVHEVLTVIRVDGDPVTYWMKWKGDPESRNSASMQRKEKMAAQTEEPNINVILSEESIRLGHPVKHVADFRKRKIAFKVEEESTGRMFTVSIDETKPEPPENVTPLYQVEIEYAETPQQNIKRIPSHYSLTVSCDKLLKAFSHINVKDCKLTPTQLRKIEWLYAVTQLNHE